MPRKSFSSADVGRHKYYESFTDKEKKSIALLYTDYDMNKNQLAKRFNCGREVIVKILKEEGVENKR